MLKGLILSLFVGLHIFTAIFCSVCPQNEKKSDCIHGGCYRRNCSELRRPKVCKDLAKEYCIKGCVCERKYLRNNDGDCIPINYCPEKTNTKCRGQNEYYENCSDTTCTGNPCEEGCQCVLGYIRNRKGKCVVNRDQYPYKQSTPTGTKIKPISKVTISQSNEDGDKALDKIWQGNAAFTQFFLRLKTIENPKKSFIASPFSVLLPLAQLALYANGPSYEQLRKILNVNKTEMRPGIRRLLDNFKLPKNVTLLLGQRVYCNKEFELTDNFKYDTKVYFDAEAQSLDFSRSANAAKIINEWVNKQTNGLIPQLVDESMFSTLTRLVLVNAIYFKGNWLLPFNPKNTQQKDFYMTNNEKGTVKMMFQQATFRYAEYPVLLIKALELFYKDKDYSFLCVLPTSNDTYSLEGMAQQLQDPKIFKEIIDGLNYEEVRVSLPSIETSTTTDLSKILQNVNVTAVFNPINSGLTGIIKQPESVFISAAIQKAVVIINELGSEAAAANAIVTRANAIRLTKSFEANHPYFYFILYKKNILFCGAYTGA